MRSYDLAVAYRICPRVSRSALDLPFGDDKYQLSEVCLRSFKQSLGPLRVKLWALLDGCPSEYERLFRTYMSPEDLVLMRFDGVGNRATFGKQIDVLLDQQDADLVYFAEDDYFYVPKQFAAMVEFLTAHADVHFVSPYDHLDCYTLELHRAPEWIRIYAAHHWKTAASTCLTFLTRQVTLAQYESAFRSYCRGNHDCALWLSLTKHRVFNPLTTLRLFAHRSFGWSELLRAWLYGWPHILFGSRLNLWVPMPGIATHLDSRALSPNADWCALMQQSVPASESLATAACQNNHKDDQLRPSDFTAPALNRPSAQAESKGEVAAKGLLT